MPRRCAVGVAAVAVLPGERAVQEHLRELGGAGRPADRSDALGKRIREGDWAEQAVSTYTKVEEAISAGQVELAAQLVDGGGEGRLRHLPGLDGRLRRLAPEGGRAGGRARGGAGPATQAACLRGR